MTRKAFFLAAATLFFPNRRYLLASIGTPTRRFLLIDLQAKTYCRLSRPLRMVSVMEGTGLSPDDIKVIGPPRRVS